MPVTITYLADGCWRWHIDYNVAHWEEYDFCPSDGRLLLAGNRDSQSWDFGDIKVSNLGRFTCRSGSVVLPKAPSPGRRRGTRVRAPTRPCPGGASLRQPFASSGWSRCGSGASSSPPSMSSSR